MRASERSRVWVQLPACRVVQLRNRRSRYPMARSLRRPAPARKGGASQHVARWAATIEPGRGPSPGRRVVDLGAPEFVGDSRTEPPAISTFPEDRSVAVCTRTALDHAPGRGPRSAHGIVELGGRTSAGRGPEATGDQHLARSAGAWRCVPSARSSWTRWRTMLRSRGRKAGRSPAQCPGCSGRVPRALRRPGPGPKAGASPCGWHGCRGAFRSGSTSRLPGRRVPRPSPGQLRRRRAPAPLERSVAVLSTTMLLVDPVRVQVCAASHGGRPSMPRTHAASQKRPSDAWRSRAAQLRCRGLPTG